MALPQQLAPSIERHRRSENQVLWFAGAVTLVWWDVLSICALEVSVRPQAAMLAAAAALTSQLLFTAAEAVLLRFLWQGFGRELAWRRLAPRLWIASVAEALALAIAAGHPRLPDTLAVALAGTRALGSHPASAGIGFALESLGILSALRCGLSAQAQAECAGVRFRQALVMVLASVFVARIAMWWGYDLLMGRSFETWPATD